MTFANWYCPDTGAPGEDIRLLAGLHDLKHTFNELDELLLERWVENPYWQYFCGFATIQHEVPLHFLFYSGAIPMNQSFRSSPNVEHG